MSSTDEVAQRLIESPVPLLLPDTCSLLDVLSGPERITPEALRSAIAVWMAQTAGPPRIAVVLAELVASHELPQRRSAAEAALRGFCNRLEDHYRDLAFFAGALASRAPHPPADAITELQRSLADVFDGLCAGAIRLDRDEGCERRGVERMRDKRPPAHRGGGKDAIIFEEYLALCRRLRDGGFQQPIALLSSNTSDYAEAGAVHPEIAADLDSLGVVYCPDWLSARRVLNIERTQ